MTNTNKYSTREIIKKIFNWNNNPYNRYHSIQIETLDPKYNREFMEYLIKNSEIVSTEAIGGRKSNGFRRYQIDLDPIETLHMSETGIACGIKIVIYPIGTLMEYQRWEGGYIEGFIRMDSDTPNYGEWIIFTYSKMDKLEEIIEKFRDKLVILEDLENW